MKTISNMDPNEVDWHPCLIGKYFPERIVKPDTTPSRSPWGEKTSQMGENNTTL